MIYRLRYCNKDGVEARVDIQKGSSTPVIEVEGTERPFILSYNNDKGDKSGMFLSSSADIEIYETPDFNIDNLKTSNETELSVTHYIDNVITWQGFIIPDFFSIEVRNNPVITMTASDRLGTLKNVTLSDLPSMISLRELAILCLNKTGLTLPLKTMADFSNGTGINDFFNSKILTQRLSNTKGRSISCYDILSSILTASNSFLVQRSGAWHIINKIQHEAGSGKLYTDATSFTNWSEVIFNFSDINIGGRRTIVPVASMVGVYHEHGGGRLHPDNYDFHDNLTGWTAKNGFTMFWRNNEIIGWDSETNEPIYGDETKNGFMINHKNRSLPLSFPWFDDNFDTWECAETTVPVVGEEGAIKVEVNINVSQFDRRAFMDYQVLAVNGDTILALDPSGSFVDYDPNNINLSRRIIFKEEINTGLATAYSRAEGTINRNDAADFDIKIRIFGGNIFSVLFVNFVSVKFSSVQDTPNGTIFKTTQGSNFTKQHDTDTSIFGDYLTSGLNGYFYPYSIDDTSSLLTSSGNLTTRWTAPGSTEELPLLQHVTRQRSRMFSVAHDLLSAEIDSDILDPLAVFRDCAGKKYVMVSGSQDFLRGVINVEIEEIAYDFSILKRDYIYSYFGEGEEGVSSVGGISEAAPGGGGGGMTPEQLEILNNLSSWWKYDEVNDAIYSDLSVYSKKEVSAYGLGESGGGTGYERLDAWADYSSDKSGWVLSALLGNELNTRVGNLEGGSALTVNTTGTGNAITSISKAGTVITANKGLTFSLDNHLHTGVYEPVFTKNTAFNKDFGTTAGTVAEGNDSRIINGQTAYSWGNHASAGYALNSSLSNYLPLAGGTLTGNLTAPTFVGALNGNAASATKLQTARTIWGQSFDGTGNVSGALSGATTIAASISVASPKVIFNAAGWSMEQVGNELQMKHNNVLKMRFTSTGSIVATEEITAFG